MAPQFGVESILSKQLFVAALLNNLPLIHYHQLVHSLVVELQVVHRLMLDVHLVVQEVRQDEKILRMLVVGPRVDQM